MPDVIVKLKAGLPKGQWNGLAPIGEQISQNRGNLLVAVAILGVPMTHTTAGGQETVDLQVVRVEAVTDPEEAEIIRRFLRRIHESRLGVKSLPGTEFDEGTLASLVDEELEG